MALNIAYYKVRFFCFIVYAFSSGSHEGRKTSHSQHYSYSRDIFSFFITFSFSSTSLHYSTVSLTLCSIFGFSSAKTRLLRNSIISSSFWQYSKSIISKNFQLRHFFPLTFLLAKWKSRKGRFAMHTNVALWCLNFANGNQYFVLSFVRIYS